MDNVVNCIPFRVGLTIGFLIGMFFTITLCIVVKPPIYHHQSGYTNVK